MSLLLLKNESPTYEYLFASLLQQCPINHKPNEYKLLYPSKPTTFPE
jgi:hypothetical protein